MQINRVSLGDSARVELKALVRNWYHSFSQKPEISLSKDVRILAEDLPRALRGEILRFVLDDNEPAMLLHKLWEPTDCGDTPSVKGVDRTLSNPVQVLMGIIMSLTGTPYGYANQQAGRVCNDVVPLPEFEEIGSSSSGSLRLFDLHTEDAYHPFPPDYVGLFCIRNNECAATVVSSIPEGAIEPDDFVQLSQSLFEFTANRPTTQSQSELARLKPVLFGSSRSPYIQINLAAATALPDGAAGRAFQRLAAILRANQSSIVLHPGDFLLLNNLRAVHGRREYRTAYQHSKRWLVRVLARSEIRRCPRAEGTPASHPILL